MPESYFRQARNVELSTVYFIDTQVQANWSNITVVKANPNFPAATLPVISVRLLNTTSEMREIGSRLMEDRYNFIIDIYAKSDGQRLDLAQFIQDTIIQDWTYYLHSQTSGSPETLSRTVNGKVKFIQFLQNTRIDFLEQVETYDRFRHLITFDVRVAPNA